MARAFAFLHNVVDEMGAVDEYGQIRKSKWGREPTRDPISRHRSDGVDNPPTKEYRQKIISASAQEN